MKKLQRFCVAVVFASALSLSAFAGEISTPGDVQPPPPPPSTNIATTGEMGCPGITSTGDIQTPGVAAVDPLTEATLGLLQDMLSVF